MSKNYIEDFKKAGVQFLDDDELEQITGGKDYDNWCWFDYCCYLAIAHPCDDSDASDACMLVFSSIVAASRAN